MENECIKPPENLLRTELLTITGIMITRLRLHSFRQHLVAPVSTPKPTTAFEPASELITIIGTPCLLYEWTQSQDRTRVFQKQLADGPEDQAL